MNTQKFKDNGYNKFPLSTDTLEFMQEQIKLLYGLSSLVGQNIIIQDSTATTDGLVIFNGEIMPLKGSRLQSISRKEVSEDISFNDTTIEGARIKRYAVYASVAGIPRAAFTEIKSIKEIMDDLAEAKRHHSPKGTVIDWYGEASCENIPYGWVPCGGFFKTAGGQYQSQGSIPAAITTEKNKWLARYPNATIDVEFHYGPHNSYIRITNIPGFGNIPNLSHRFIVGAGYNSGFLEAYDFQNAGGNDYVTLTAAQSGLPAHTHDATTTLANNSRVLTIGDRKDHGTGSSNTYVTEKKISASTTVSENSPTSASQHHENRPPYYALYKLIKVI